MKPILKILIFSLFFLPVTVLAQTTEGTEIPGDSINVPIDHDVPEKGTFTLYYEFGAEYNSEKPTVFLIADGQQFHIRRGRVKKLQEGWFDDRFNVVGIPGRIIPQKLLDMALNADNSVNWEKAYQIFNSRQWCGDIDELRKHILGEEGKVMLFGGSGGAYLIHEYLARYGKHASRVFTEAAANPFLDAELGIISDRFWDEIGDYDPKLQKKMHEILKKYVDERPEIIMTFSRQHYYFKADKIQQARAELIDSLYNGNMEFYERAKKDFKVNEVASVMETEQAIPIRIRMYEIIRPILERVDLFGDTVYPGLEVAYNLALPLIMLNREDKIPVPLMNFSSLKNLSCDIFILAGRWDEAVDYRTQIELAKKYKNSTLFIADDDHMFKSLKEAGLLKEIIRTFFYYGSNSIETQKSLKKFDPYKWEGKNKK